MIVELSADVFEAPSVDRLDLLELLRRCRGDPHAVLLDPPFDRAALPRGFDAVGALHDEVSLILEYGPEQAAKCSVSCARIRVRAAGPSSYLGPVPTLTVSDARRLLSRPLRILVENRRNDGAFLRKALPPDRRVDFERYEREGYVLIDSEGGLGEMKRRVEQLAAAPEEAARITLVFDRDCRGDAVDAPLGASKAAQDLSELCATVREPWPLCYHMLQRRAIENYLPLAALFGWASGDRRLTDLAEAFKDLSFPQRCCFPMKRGLIGDVTPAGERDRLERTQDPLEDPHLTPLFRPLDPVRRERLRRGFGSDVAELFQDEEGVARVHETEIGLPERQAIALIIQERL